MKQNLNEELERMKEIMGLNLITEKALAPFARGPLKSIVGFVDDAARANRVFAGDQAEIQTALNAMKAARQSKNLKAEFDAMYRLMKASSEIAEEITPTIINLAKNIKGGSQVVDDIDKVIVALRDAGKTEAEIVAATDALIESAFVNTPSGFRDGLKNVYARKTSTAMANRPSNVQPSSTNTSSTNTPPSTFNPADEAERIYQRLETYYAGNPKALAQLQKMRNGILSIWPRTPEEGAQLFRENVSSLETFLGRPLTPKERHWFIKAVSSSPLATSALKIGGGAITMLIVMKIVKWMSRITGGGPTILCDGIEITTEMSCDEWKKYVELQMKKGTEKDDEKKGGKKFTIPDKDRGALNRGAQN